MKVNANKSPASGEDTIDTVDMKLPLDVQIPVKMQNVRYINSSALTDSISGETCVRFVGRDASGTAVYHLSECSK